MRLKLLYILLLLFAVNVFTSEAQNKKEKALTQVKFNENTNAPLTTMEMSILTEAYGESLEALVLSKSQRLKDLKHLLRNRIQIVDAKNKEVSHFPLMSSQPTFKYYKKSFSKNILYQGLNFNPLQFNLNFYSKEATTYRIDNTNYILIIKPQH